jgi:hypothetical protein
VTVVGPWPGLVAAVRQQFDQMAVDLTEFFVAKAR